MDIATGLGRRVTFATQLGIRLREKAEGRCLHCGKSLAYCEGEARVWQDDSLPSAKRKALGKM